MADIGVGTEVVPGVRRLGTQYVNWYLVDDDERVTVIDAGVPGYWPQLEPALGAMGRTLDDVAGVVLTHAHGDHTGVSGRLHERGVPVMLQREDEELMRTGKQPKREASPLPHLWRPGVWAFFIHFMRNGALRPPHIEDTIHITDSQELELPGRPFVVYTPGHTLGHCAVHLPEHRVILVGDLLCTWNPLTGRRGPQIMPRAFNFSSTQSLVSLERIEHLDAEVVLPGHGEPWTDGIAAAVARAREAGPS